ncbi:MAG: hypothetical protein BRD26_05605 [Bacteroidetes bacterium QH_1_64_81]|nr:MAG: hypothetical protein BRD26_05605 [Bacteroidetes bacterium QH_1_64_81]
MERWIQRRTWRDGLLLLVGLLVGTVTPAEAQLTPRIEARVSADSVKIGERFTLTLVAERAEETEVVFPAADAGAPLFGDLHVLGRGAVQTRRPSEARRIDSVAYEVTTFALDSARVPILPVRLVAGDDTTVAGSAPRVVPVGSVVGPDAEGLRAPALLASFPRPFWWWGVLGLTTMALLAGLAYVWWRRTGEDASETPDEAPKDPYEAASDRLQRLERRNPSGREACTAFYVDLTETLRVYVARRVGVRALERTTPEVLAALHHRPEVDDRVVRRLEGVLEQADLVKFADAQPPPEESQSVLQDAQDVLDSLEAAQRRVESRTSDEAATT